MAVASTHGAGDAFVGALAARMAAGVALEAALLVAAPAAAAESLGPAAVEALPAEAAAS